MSLCCRLPPPPLLLQPPMQSQNQSEKSANKQHRKARLTTVPSKIPANSRLNEVLV